MTAGGVLGGARGGVFMEGSVRDRRWVTVAGSEEGGLSARRVTGLGGGWCEQRGGSGLAGNSCPSPGFRCL